MVDSKECKWPDTNLGKLERHLSIDGWQGTVVIAAFFFIGCFLLCGLGIGVWTSEKATNLFRR